jgi:hypothetical protein
MYLSFSQSPLSRPSHLGFYLQSIVSYTRLRGQWALELVASQDANCRAHLREKRQVHFRDLALSRVCDGPIGQMDIFSSTDERQRRDAVFSFGWCLQDTSDDSITIGAGQVQPPAKSTGK